MALHHKHSEITRITRTPYGLRLHVISKSPDILHTCRIRMIALYKLNKIFKKLSYDRWIFEIQLFSSRPISVPVTAHEHTSQNGSKSKMTEFADQIFI